MNKGLFFGFAIALVFLSGCLQPPVNNLTCDLMYPVYAYPSSSEQIGFACSLSEAQELCTQHYHHPIPNSTSFVVVYAQERIEAYGSMIGYECLQ